MSVAPVSPVVATLPTDIVGPTQAALNAIVETVAIADTAVLLELAAPSTTPPAANPTQANPLAQAVDAARTTAAMRQGSLAPLFADLTQAAASPALPAALKAAVSQVLALQLPTDGPVTAEAVQQAVSRSGLFLEAHFAAAPPNAAAPPLDLKAALLVLQRALAAVAQPPAPAAPATPAQVDRPPAPTASTAQAPPASGPLTAETLKQAVAQSGPFLEAHLANPAAPAGASPPDLKAAQAILQRALAAAPAAAAPSPAGPPALPAPLRAAVVQLVAQQLPAAGPINAATIRQAVVQASAVLDAHLANPALEGRAPPPEEAPPELKAALQVLQRALNDNASASAPPEPRAAVPPPPHRQAAPTAQPAARATLPADAEPAAIAQHLKGQVAQAVARQTLHQVASLPDAAAPAWMFELPMATPQGAAIAQFIIDRDGEASSGSDPAETWRARFSIDIEPLGPVHVHLRMAGDKAAVTVWAERAESLEQLRGEGGDLARALPAEVTFRRGTPPRQPAPASGRFIDQTS